jgi:hypothetical protein
MTNRHPHDHLDADLRPLASSLDALGAAERDAAPPGLEQRLLASTLPHLRGETSHADPHAEAPAVVARIGPRLSRPAALRLAAAVLLFAGAIAGVSIVLSPGPAPPVDIATEDLIESIDTELDQWLADLEALDDIYTDTRSTTEDLWDLDESLTTIEEATS